MEEERENLNLVPKTDIVMLRKGAVSCAKPRG